MKVLASLTHAFRDLCTDWLAASIGRSNPSMEIVTVLDDSETSAGNGNFRSPGFDAHIANKMATIAEWAERETEPFLVTDVDVIYFRSAEKLLLESLGDGDIALSAEHWGNDREYNIGQMIIRPGSRTHRFFNDVKEVLRAGGSRDRFRQNQPANQHIINEMLRAGELDHRMLPPVFSNTAIFREMGYYERRTLVSYHATGTIPNAGRTSLEIKVELLKQVSTIVEKTQRSRQATEPLSSPVSDETRPDLEELGAHLEKAYGRALVVGSGDGRLLEWILGSLFPSSESEVHAVGQYDSKDGNSIHHPAARAVLHSKIKELGLEKRVHLYDGEFSEALAWMVAGDGYWESFDLVYLEARPASAELLMSACFGWNLLKPGGCITWVQDKVSAAAIDSFLTSFWDRGEVVHEGAHVIVRKHRSLAHPEVPASH